MKNYFNCLSAILVLILTFGSAGIISVSADTTYTPPEKFIYGDVDLDGSVTVKDATLIQKGLAKVTYVTAVQKYLADPDGTGYSVKNATAIQKYLAKYETSTPWGTELIMASQDEFSSQFSELRKYDVNMISVRAVRKMEFSHQYTLEDFPEYNFSEIVAKGSEEKGYIIYRLYLAEPSQENLKKALKALDYRANIDIESISLSSYSKPAG